MIKTIVNNEEKEIEQIRLNNNKYVDYIDEKIGDGNEYEGNLPINIKFIGKGLQNYKIYGNTVNGNSVGDKTSNLFNPENVLVNYAFLNTNIVALNDRCIIYAPATQGMTYTLVLQNLVAQIESVLTIDEPQENTSFEINNSTTLINHGQNILTASRNNNKAEANYIAFQILDVREASTAMIVSDSTPPENYEPYGYKVPVTITNGTDTQTTNIYLPEQIKMVGNEAEYIDFGEQKQYFIDGTFTDITLPNLPTFSGINTLSVETTVQPSKVYIKENINYKRIFIATRSIENNFDNPYTFKSIDIENSTLKNYRIYGNTESYSYSGSAPLSFPIVDGAVINYRVYGKNSKNLLQNAATSQTINGVRFTVNGDGSVDYERISTAERDSDLYLIGTLNSTEVTELKPNTNYIFSGGANSKAYVRVVGFGISDGLDVVADNSTQITYNEGKILLRVRVTETGSGTFYPMIRLASVTDDTYEPYGESVGDLVTDSQSEHYGNYAIPITNNAETSNIYLDAPLRKVGDEADYVDYATQKWHRVRKNLFDPSTNIVNGSLTGQGYLAYYSNSVVTGYIPISVGTYTFSMSKLNYGYVCAYNSEKQHIAKAGTREIWLPVPFTFSVPEDGYIRFVLRYGNSAPLEPSDACNIMLNAGEEALPYEPYIENTEVDVTLPTLPAQSSTNSLSVDTTVQPSIVAVDVSKNVSGIVSCGDKVTDSQDVNYGKYKIPVTLTADSTETTNIYLDEPLAKSGNNADYIDYATQKRHNSDGTESNITLPEIIAEVGINTLSVETTVKPSKMYIKGHIKDII